jgi:hypothetical protein
MSRGVVQGGKEQQGSPRMAEAVRLYFDHPTLTAVQALKLADFSKEEAESRTKQKTLSKRRRKAECALGKENKRRGVQECRARQRIQSNPLASIDVQSVSNLSGLTEDESQDTDAASSIAASSSVTSSINNSTTRRAVLCLQLFLTPMPAMFLSPLIVARDSRESHGGRHNKRRRSKLSVR